MQKISVFQLKSRIFFDNLPFYLKLDNRNRLMHLHVQHCFAGIIVRIILQFKAATWIIPICVQCKCSKRQEVNSIAILQNLQICISCTDADNICNTALLSCCRPHPEHVMISPLDIHRMITHQLVHNNMWSRPTIINISYNMQMIYSKSLDQFTQSHNKLFGTFDPDDRIYNRIIIGLLIHNICFLCNQFLNDISKFRRQSFSDFRSGILT